MNVLIESNGSLVYQVTIQLTLRNITKGSLQLITEVRSVSDSGGISQCPIAVDGASCE